MSDSVEEEHTHARASSQFSRLLEVTALALSTSRKSSTMLFCIVVGLPSILCMGDTYTLLNIIH